MTIHLDGGAWVQYVIAGLVATVAYLVKWGVNRVCTQIDTMNMAITDTSSRITTISVKVGEMQTWQEGHEDLDNQRHQELVTKMEAL